MFLWRWWRIYRMRKQLAVLLAQDRAVRGISGATSREAIDQIVANGHEIAMLRYCIRKLEEMDR